MRRSPHIDTSGERRIWWSPARKREPGSIGTQSPSALPESIHSAKTNPLPAIHLARPNPFCQNQSSLPAPFTLPDPIWGGGNLGGDSLGGNSPGGSTTSPGGNSLEAVVREAIVLLPAERHPRPWSGNQLARGLAINRGTKVHAWGATRARSPQPAHGLAIIREQKFTSGCDSGPIHFGGIFGRINTDRHPITFVECPSASQTTRTRAWGPQQHKRTGLHGIAPDPQGRAPNGYKEFY